MESRKRIFRKGLSLTLAFFIGVMAWIPSLSASAGLIVADASKWKTNLEEIAPVGGTDVSYTDAGASTGRRWRE